MDHRQKSFVLYIHHHACTTKSLMKKKTERKNIFASFSIKVDRFDSIRSNKENIDLYIYIWQSTDQTHQRFEKISHALMKYQLKGPQWCWTRTSSSSHVVVGQQAMTTCFYLFCIYHKQQQYIIYTDFKLLSLSPLSHINLITETRKNICILVSCDFSFPHKCALMQLLFILLFILPCGYWIVI